MTCKGEGELQSEPLMIVNRSGVNDHFQYFAGDDLSKLRARQEEEIRAFGGNFKEVARRISQIVHFCEPASYRQIFLSSPDDNRQNLHELLVSSSEGLFISEELRKRCPQISDKYIGHYVILEFIHSSDPRIRQQYDEIVGKRLFNSIPPSLIFVSEGFPKVGLLRSEPPTHSDDFCILEECESSWNGGFTVISESGRQLYLNAGIEHYVGAHHLFETSPQREAYDQNIYKGRNEAAISPADFYKHFMRRVSSANSQK